MPLALAIRVAAESPSEGNYPTDAEVVTHHDTVTNFALSADILSVQSGNWSDNDTWDLARPPEAGEIVGIKTTHTVTYDVDSTDVILAVGVAGTLAFRTDIDTELWVQNLLVYGPPTLGDGNYGTLAIGTDGDLVDSSVVATIVFPDAALLDPNTGGVTNKQYSNGLLCWGELTVRGQVKTPFIRLDGPVAATDTTLTFESAVTGWAASDRLLVPDSRHVHDSEDLPLRIEIRTASAIGGGGTSATVSAMTYAHPAAVDKDDVQDFAAHCVNLTRNVVFKSEDPDSIRGHVQCFERAKVDIRYVRFESLGRTLNASLPNTTTNQKGRYPLHCHHILGPGDGTEGEGGLGYDASVDPDEFKPSEVENIRTCDGPVLRVIGCSFEDTSTTHLDMKWPITLHGTCDALLKSNVIYKATGSGIMFEDGVECYNVIADNFVCYVSGTGDRGDASYVDGAPGREGNGFSIPNPRNFIRNNVVGTLPGYPSGLACAFHLYNGSSIVDNGGADGQAALHIAAFQGADPEDDFETNDIYTVLEFADNEVYCCLGIIIWYIGAHTSSVFTPPIAESTILRFKCWHGGGLDNYPSWNVVMRDCIGRGDWNSIGQSSVFFDGRDYLTRGASFYGCDIQGFRIGIEIPVKVGGSADPNSSAEDVIVIDNCILCNYFNIVSETPNGVTGGGASLSPRRFNVTNTDLILAPVSDGDDPRLHLELTFKTGEQRPNINWVVSDKMYFYDTCTVDGDPIGETYRVYWTESAGDFITPQSGGGHYGSPEAGQTNTENLAEHGVCVAGAIAPTTDTLSRFDGYVEVI